MKKNTGITLVALVITIIILLILAGVAISMITGGEGLFAKANDAATKYNQAAKNEADLLNQLLNGNYLNNGGNGQGGDNPAEDPDIRKDNKTINGSETGSAENPIIPQGFKPVNEGNANWGDGTTTPPGWNDGLVIQDKDGNQFVWVPVQLEISEAIQTKLNNGTALTVEEIQATWTRKAWATNKDISTRGTLDTTKYTEPYSKGTGYANENADYIEMGTSVLKNGGFYVGRYEGGTESVRTSSSDPTNTLVCKAHVYPYNWIVWGKSMSDISKPDTDYEGNTVGSKGAVEICREMYTGKKGYSIKSSLIYGVQWDSIMEWIENERNVSNSSEWGNYNNRAYTIKTGTEYYTTSTGWQTATADIEKTTSNSYLLKTGEYAETKTGETTNTNGIIKNIYDLAGNCWEWTMEASLTRGRVDRGGGYNGNGDDGPASRRIGSSPNNAYHIRRGKSSTLLVTLSHEDVELKQQRVESKVDNIANRDGAFWQTFCAII